MKWWKATVGLLLGALIFAGFPQRLSADGFNKRTIVTLNDAVEVPGGTILQPGTYVFRLMDSPSNRNIVQIFDKDEQHVYATILAVPNYRLEPSDKTLITLEERPAGSPQALKAWFYPGDLYGQEFVYPQSRATELAKSTDQNVLTMPSELSANTLEPAQSSDESQVQAMKNAPVGAVGPSGEEVDMSQQVSPPAQTTQSSETQDTANSAKDELPKTASSLPLIVLLGTLSVAAAVGLRVLAKRTA